MRIDFPEKSGWVGKQSEIELASGGGGGGGGDRYGGIKKDDRVKRGPDWKWDNQDGGAGNLGTVIELKSDGWIRVKWDKGGTNAYRTADVGGTDLVKATGEKRLASAADTRAGATLRFSPISSYDYPSSAKKGELVTYIETNSGTPPAHVR